MHVVVIPVSDTQSYLHKNHNLDDDDDATRRRRRWWRRLPARRSNVVGMIGTGRPERANWGNESAMVRLPNRRCLSSSSLLASINSTTGRQIRDSSWRRTCILFPDDLAGCTFPLDNTLAVQNSPAGSTEPVRAPAGLPETQPARTGLRTARARLSCAFSGPYLPPYCTTNLSDSIIRDVLGALQGASHRPYATRSSLPSLKPHHTSPPRLRSPSHLNAIMSSAIMSSELYLINRVHAYSRVSEDELLYVLHKPWELCLWPGSPFTVALGGGRSQKHRPSTSRE
jgi:hypothetical protein